VDAIYMTLLSRKPNLKEKDLWLQAQAQGLSTIDDLIFSLLNTQQFIFDSKLNKPTNTDH